jgi:hypothetical protein
MAQRRLSHSLVASINQLAQEATMYTKLNYMIAQQHQAGLVQNAQRNRLVAEAGALRSAAKPATALRRFWGRISSIAQTTPRAAGDGGSPA